jgi:hypothetical protein
MTSCGTRRIGSMGCTTTDVLIPRTGFRNDDFDFLISCFLCVKPFVPTIVRLG